MFSVIYYLHYFFSRKKHSAANIKKIVLPEGDDDRTLRAAEILVNEKLADPVVLHS
ncbi:MAG: hypothetical protein J5739_05550 [Lachnospiraceae bacterium]|nr:hypothetical protein [Lachnospiraceae bacterium]